MKENFGGKNVIVTGGSNGIGAAITKRFADSGANVFFTYLKDKAAAQEVVRYAEERGVRATSKQCTMEKKVSVDKMFASAKSFFGSRIDILVNNAGFGVEGSGLDLDYDQIDNLVRGNLTAHLYTSKLAIPYLKRSRGYIVNIASRSGLNGDPSCVPYSAAKAGMIGMTKSLAKYCGDEVIVNSLSPSWVKTNWLKAVGKKDVEASIAKSVIKRVFEPDEIADFVLFLCSQRAVTGNNYIIDGGGLMQ